MLSVSLDHRVCLTFHSAVLVADVSALQHQLGCTAVACVATRFPFTQAFDRL